MTSNDHSERALALSYAPRDRRAALAALFALDAALGQVLRTTREPMVGQLRLAWWREALERLDTASPPAEPVLQALAAEVLPLDVTGTALAAMTDGWEVLLGPIDARAIEAHGRLRGATWFELAGMAIGATRDPLTAGGRGWALADLAGHLCDPTLATRAREAARPLLGEAAALRWTRAGRALGALVHIARLDLAGPPTAARVARLAWHRLTGC